MRQDKATRRQFLKGASTLSIGAIGFPYIVRSSALGLADTVAPSNRLVMGCIGMGGQGRGNMGGFINQGVQVVAVCDVNAKHRDSARDAVNDHYHNKDCKAYTDFQELVARKDIDLVLVATPDHWHGLTALAAVKAGKDVYCEKPLVNHIAEGRALSDAVTKGKRILQTGSQERSGSNARYACELVRNGRIGKLHTIRINLPCNDGHHKEVLDSGIQPEMPVPEWFNYNFWLGPAPEAFYTEKRCHFKWRFILAHGGGEMTDRGAHVIDIAQLGNGTDDSGPIEFEAHGERPKKSNIYDTFFKYKFECKYANGVRMIGQDGGDRGLKFEGDKGSIFIHIHGGNLNAEPASLLKEKIGENEIHLGRSPGHHENFLESVKTRKLPVAHAEIGHRTASLCHLLNIAMITGKKLKWDPAKEQITNDDEANKLVSHPLRKPWHL